MIKRILSSVLLLTQFVFQSSFVCAEECVENSEEKSSLGYTTTQLEQANTSAANLIEQKNATQDVVLSQDTSSLSTSASTSDFSITSFKDQNEVLVKQGDISIY